jgi:hypothetical protein
MRGLADTTAIVISMAVLLGLSWPARADAPTIAMRSGTHPGFERLVFDLPPGIEAGAVQTGTHVAISFKPAGRLASVSKLPRNVDGIEITDTAATLSLAAGAAIHTMRLASRLVVDVVDPVDGHSSAAPMPPPPPTKPATSTKPIGISTAQTAPPAGRSGDETSPSRSHVRQPPPPMSSAQSPHVAPIARAPKTPEPLTPVPVARPIALAPVTPVDRANLPAAASAAAISAPDGPISLAAQASAPIGDGSGHSVTLPFDTDTGAAAFVRDQIATLIFDQRRPIDMALVRDDPLLGSGTVQLLETATVLRLPIAPGATVGLARARGGWTVTVQPQGRDGMGQPVGASRSIGVEATDKTVRLVAKTPGQVIAVPDVTTGRLLLVGTQRQPGEFMPVARRTPEFALLPTIQGVVLQLVSDRISLRATPDGFQIEAGAGRAVAWSTSDANIQLQADARHFSRRFDFPARSLDALLRREQEAVVSAASAPAQDRAAARLAVAQAMLSLGMGAEAHAVLGLTAAEDPHAATEADMHGLVGIAAVLAGRPAEANGLSDPRLSGSDEIALWRAARTAMMQEGAPEAAQVFAANAGLLLAYPQPMRDQLLPLAVETMVLGGERVAARPLLMAQANDHRLDLARGFLAELDAKDAARPGLAVGDVKPALAIYDAVAAGGDQLASARAGRRAVELGLAAGLLTAPQAADAMDRMLYAWRGDNREPALRRRVAELRAQAGQWRQALAMLRESAMAWPSQQPPFLDLLKATFAAALADDARHPLNPLDLVALVGENADLLPSGDDGLVLADRLAQRLVQLDLPQRAIPVLQQLATATPPGPARGAIGGRLADLLLTQGDPPGALAALDASAAEDLPDDLRLSRAMTAARATAAKGDLNTAIAMLAALDTPQADLQQADLLETARRWPDAERALHAYVARALPASGALDDGQAQIIVRLAAAAAQAGDEVTLADLHAAMLPRLPAGRLAGMLGILTERPISGVSDLGRSANETQLARSLPDALKSVVP